MRGLILAAVFACVLALSAAATNDVAEVKAALAAKGKDGCLVCVEDIMNAVTDCGMEDNILQCITDALGAASDCIGCICEILQIIGGFDDICP